MFERAAAGMELVKRSLRFIKKDKHILAFPIFSLIAAFITFGILFLVVGLTAGFWLNLPDLLGELYVYVLVGFPLFSVLFAVMNLFNAAMVFSAYERLNGRIPTLSRSLKGVFSKFGSLFIWGSGWGVVFLFFRKKDKNSGRFYRHVPYFVIPLILFENLSVPEAIKKSGILFEETWKENVTAHLAIESLFSLISTCFCILSATVILILLIMKSFLLFWILLAISFILLIALGTVSIACERVLMANLYYYAAKKKVSPILAGGFLEKVYIKNKKFSELKN